MAASQVLEAELLRNSRGDSVFTEPKIAITQADWWAT